VKKRGREEGGGGREGRGKALGFAGSPDKEGGRRAGETMISTIF
jgi:hypothetical protein